MRRRRWRRNNDDIDNVTRPRYICCMFRRLDKTKCGKCFTAKRWYALAKEHLTATGLSLYQFQSVDSHTHTHDHTLSWHKFQQPFSFVFSRERETGHYLSHFFRLCQFQSVSLSLSLSHTMNNYSFCLFSCVSFPFVFHFAATGNFSVLCKMESMAKANKTRLATIHL